MANQDTKQVKSTLPPELQAARKKADKQAKSEARSTAKQKAKEEKAAKKGREAATPKQTSHGGAVFAGFLYGVFFVLLLIAVGIAFYYFNVGNVRSIVIGGLKLDQDSYVIIENRRNELSKLEAEIETQQQQIQIDQTSLLQEKEALEELKDNLDEREKELDVYKARVEGQEAELAEIITLYESMDAQTAANILGTMENEDDLIKILRNLSEAKASQILSLLEPEQASSLTSKMLSTTSSR